MAQSSGQLAGYSTRTNSAKGTVMFSWAIVFLVIAVVAALFGFSGLAGTAVNIAWILAVLGIILFVVLLALGRRPPSP
jgi:uncharacterized membrane protein YtjA (UPF0391 family)